MFNIVYKYLAKFRENFIKIWAKLNENDRILQHVAEKCEKKFDENLLKYWRLSGVEACKSCRSRQKLSNEYSLAKIGFNAEHEPSKVCWSSPIRSELWGRAWRREAQVRGALRPKAPRLLASLRLVCVASRPLQTLLQRAPREPPKLFILTSS